MGGYFLKILFTLISFSPVALIYGVKGLLNGNYWYFGLVVLFFIAVFFNNYLLTRIKNEFPTIKLNVKEVNPIDSYFIGYVIAFLIPILDDSLFPIPGILELIIYAILFAVVLYANKLQLNIILFFSGYHYYGIQDGGNVARVLISKDKIQKTERLHNCRQISAFQFIHFN